MSDIRAFGRLALLSFRALFGWLSPWIYLSSLVVGPAFQILFFALVGRFGSPERGMDWYIIGNAVHACALTSVFAVGACLSQDRSAGTLGLLLISPRSRLMIFAGRAVVLILHGLVTIAFGLLLGTALLGLNLSQANWPGLVATLLLVTLTTGALGLLAAALSLVLTDMNLLLNGLVSVLLLLCGVNFAPDLLPAPLRLVSAGLPMTRAVTAARDLVGGAALADVLPLLGGEVLVGMAYLVTGYALFLVMEHRARVAGTLDLV